MRVLRFIVSVFFAVVFLSFFGTAQAATTPWQKLDHSEIRVIGGAEVGKGFRLGIQMKLDKGWKTYWRVPGDAGVPVSLVDEGSENLATFAIRWPAPERFIDFGTLQSFGYKHAVTLPVALTPKNPEAPAVLHMKLHYAVCKELCIPVEHRFTLPLSPAKLLSAEELVLLNEAEAMVPIALEAQQDIRITQTGYDASAQLLLLEAAAQNPFVNPDVVPDAGAQFRFTKPEVTLEEDGKKATFRIPAEGLGEQRELLGMSVRFTLTDIGRGVEWQQEIQSISGKRYNLYFFLLMLGFALLGGLILNLMPCVLPVLSIKILSVLKKSGTEQEEVRLSFLASAAGILFSFLLLALLVVAIQASGRTIGWGFQFQEPAFLVALIVLLVLFAANLFGLFEIRIPAWVNARMNRAFHHKSGYVEHFLTGAFATLMATPCSAPLLGTAIGFAFSQGAFETITLFLVMGLGLSIPYLLFALFPKWVYIFPKPGAWMVKVKYLLGVLLLASACWVLTILLNQARKEDALWQTFDRDVLARELASGKTVFVDVTAQWCLTCKANALFVLDTEEIQALLRAPDVVAMKADWTSRDPSISAYLKEFGRYGIPFNAVYGPANPKGVALPELLRKEMVVEALENSRKAPENQAENPRPPELP